MLNEGVIKDIFDPETTIIVDTSRHGKPSLEEDNPEDSDVDQPGDEPLEESTLFCSTQLIISRQDNDFIGLGKPSAKLQMQPTPHLQCKVHIIKCY